MLPWNRLMYIYRAVMFIFKNELWCSQKNFWDEQRVRGEGELGN